MGATSLIFRCIKHALTHKDETYGPRVPLKKLNVNTYKINHSYLNYSSHEN
jgi:hypothetical protein